MVIMVMVMVVVTYIVLPSPVGLSYVGKYNTSDHDQRGGANEASSDRLRAEERATDCLCELYKGSSRPQPEQHREPECQQRDPCNALVPWYRRRRR